MISLTSLLPLIAGFIAAILAIVGLTLPGDRLHATRYFVLLCATTSSWAFAHFAILNLSVASSPLSQSPASPVFWLGIATLLGVGGAPTYWLLFAVAATGRTRWLTGRAIIAAHVPFVFVVLAGLTNPIHGLYVTVDPATGMARYGPLAMAHLTAITLMIGTGLVWMVDAWWRSGEKGGRRRAVVIGGAAAIAFVGGLAHVVSTFVHGNLIDPSPALFIILAIAMAYELFKSGLAGLSIRPVAESLSTMSDAMLVVDRHLRIQSVNPIAEKVLPGLALGASLLDRAPEIAHHAEFCIKYACDDLAFEAVLGGSVYWGRVRRTQDDAGRSEGAVVLLTDLTALREAQDALIQLGRTVEGDTLTREYLDRLGQRQKT